jgi:hypothetical protein
MPEYHGKKTVGSGTPGCATPPSRGKDPCAELGLRSHCVVNLPLQSVPFPDLPSVSDYHHFSQLFPAPVPPKTAAQRPLVTKMR